LDHYLRLVNSQNLRPRELLVSPHVDERHISYSSWLNFHNIFNNHVHGGLISAWEFPQVT
jgi:hypothetical protein